MVDNELTAAFAKAGDDLGCDILLLNAPMNPGVDASVEDAIEQRGQLRDRVLCILVTEGGLPEVAYRASRTFAGKL